MYQQYHIRKGWRFIVGTLMAVARMTPLRVLVVVLLPLIMVTAGQAPLAQAAPFGEASLGFSLDAQKLGGERTICVGDKVDIRVTAKNRIATEGKVTNYRLIGQPIDAHVESNGIGRISPPRITTGLDSDSVGAVIFSFTALKPGATDVVFQANLGQRMFLGLAIGGNNVIANTPLTVDDCVYKVRMISTFQAQGVTLVADFEGGVKRTADDRFEGEATVNWSGGTTVARDCSGTITVAPSWVGLKGEKVDDQLVVDVLYEYAQLVHRYTCRSTSTETKAEVLPSHLRWIVLSAGSGDQDKQNLLEPRFYSMSGWAVIIVTRINR